MAKLFLIPNKIGDLHFEMQFPQGLAEVISGLKHFIVEDVRNARRFIRSICPEKNIDEIQFMSLNKHTNLDEIEGFLNPVKEGNNIGLLSEAGVPCVADPGGVIVNLAHKQNLEVAPMVGPSSILLTLMASGMNGQSFCFHGYLPIDKKERVLTLRNLEKTSKANNQTQIFIETPFRNNQLLKDIADTCKSDTSLCLGVEMYNQNGYVKTKSIQDWKKKIPDLHKKMVVFLICSC